MKKSEKINNNTSWLIYFWSIDKIDDDSKI